NEALAGRSSGTVPGFAPGAGHRSAAERHPLCGGRLGVAHARRLRPGLGGVAERHGNHAIHLLSAGRRPRVQPGTGRADLRARAARNVPAAPGKHIRPRMGGWRHLPRCLPPERGRAVEVPFRARQYRDAVRALPPVRSRGQAPDRRAVRSSGLRDGAQVLAYLQPARCARRDLGDRARRLHRPRARTCPSGRQSLLRLARAAGFSPGEAPAPEAPEEKGASIMPERKSARAPAVATLLVEVLTEELPPKALKRLSEAFAEVLAADLRHEDFLTAESNVRVYATPRRLAVQIAAVRSRAPDKAVEFSG